MDDVRLAKIGVFWSVVITAAFTLLKLTGVIDWSWWWVLLPLYGPVVLLAIVYLIAIIAFYAAPRR